MYSLLEGQGNIHLSTLMYPAHRARLISEIRARLKEDLPCRVVATSLIEAGVDVDFPAVFRGEAGLDSILQAAGRCNREGKRPADESLVTVFQSQHGAPRIFSANIGAYREAAARHPDIAAPAAVEAYFSALLGLRGDALDKYQVVDGFSRGLDGAIFPFRTISERFRMIDTATKTVFIPTDESRPLLDALRAGLGSRELYRKLGRYGVAVYPLHFAALANAGDIELIEEGQAILTNDRLYNCHTGLSLAADEGKGLWI